MESYGLDSVLNFGKHKGRKLKHIAFWEFSYLEYCIVNISNFYISAEVIEEIKTLKLELVLNPETINALENKNLKSTSEFSDYEEENDLISFENCDYEDDTDWDLYNDDLDADQQSLDFWNQF